MVAAEAGARREGSELPQALRYLVVAAVVAFWMALGFALHLTGVGVDYYLLLGVPISIAFQGLIARRPLLDAWVRGSPSLRPDWVVAVVFVLLAIVPAYTAVMGFQARQWPLLLYGLAAIVGALGAAYAIRNARRPMTWQIPLCVVIVVVIGEGLTFLSGLLSGRILDISGRQRVVTAGYYFLLYIPALFMMEEVFFRGVLDTFIHERERRAGWLSALWISALWGIWHLPTVWHGGSTARIALTVGDLLLGQIVIGIPLSMFWRRSGNLLVPGVAHALNDSIRNIITGLP
ncbi:MAG: lysostaphin resistance A-like protein [Candidatus Dormibacteraceae bacterium]